MNTHHPSERSYARFLAVALLLYLVPCIARTHPGGLDLRGGHINRAAGEYHYHQKPASGYTPPPEIEFKAQNNTERFRNLGNYFRDANAGVISYTGGTTPRDVSGSQRKRVLERDGGKCVVCAHTYNLEVDHRRALMNGGDNSLENLATLCRDCHVAKTKMDNSLRRKRASWSPYSFNPKAPPGPAVADTDRL